VHGHEGERLVHTWKQGAGGDASSARATHREEASAVVAEHEMWPQWCSSGSGGSGGET
jgi:hypothetical protein